MWCLNIKRLLGRNEKTCHGAKHEQNSPKAVSKIVLCSLTYEECSSLLLNRCSFACRRFEALPYNICIALETSPLRKPCSLNTCIRSRIGVTTDTSSWSFIFPLPDKLWVRRKTIILLFDRSVTWEAVFSTCQFLIRYTYILQYI